MNGIELRQRQAAIPDAGGAGCLRPMAADERATVGAFDVNLPALKLRRGMEQSPGEGLRFAV